jgi:FkbM family methyltransferase
VNSVLIRIIVFLLGRTLAYRVGRGVYLRARGDGLNEISVNGELMIQASVLQAAQTQGRKELCCFDVGANVGGWSLPLLELCDAKEYSGLTLHLFEPVPSTMQLLRKKISHRQNVSFEELALSSSEGVATMHVLAAGAGTNSLHAAQAQDEAGTIEVRTSTVQKYCLDHQIENIDLFKCDAEGHDAKVIQGALPLLRQGRIAVLQFEYNFRWIFAGHYLKDVFDEIRGLPYQVGKICQDHIETYPGWHFELDRFFESNYVLIREDALSWFNVQEYRFNNSNALTASN